MIKANIDNISYIKKYIYNWKYLKANSIDSNLKNECIAYCPELLFGILSFFSYVDIEGMDIIFSSVERNEYKLLGIKSKHS